MKVYIEVVLLDNLLMTAAIGLMSYFIMGIKAGKIRLAIASVAGAAISIVYPFIPVGGWLLVGMKILIGVILALILFIRKCNILRGVLVFFGMTALAGGLCVLVNYLIIGDFVVSVTAAPVMPYCACTCIVCALILAGKTVWEKTKKRRLRSSYHYDVDVTLFGKSYKLKGFLDSGNTLYDNSSGLPVVVVKLSAIEKKLDDRLIVLLLSGDASLIDGVRYISTQGLGGQTRLAVVKPEKLELYFGKNVNTNKSVMVGVSVKDFGGDADVLLHPAMIGGN